MQNMKPFQLSNGLRKVLRNLRLAKPSIHKQDILSVEHKIMSQQQDLLALSFLSPLTSEYLPWSSSAMRPSGLVTVLNDIVLHNRTVCLECGSGISTFYIAKLLKNRGGHLISVEHDKQWADFITGSLNQMNLCDVVSIVYVPLKKIMLDSEDYLWYDQPAIIDQIGDVKLELLLIDGPPAFTDDLQSSRYPALPVFRRYLADSFTIILDDINRPGEQHIMERWQVEFGIDFEFRFINGNIAIGKAKSQFNI